MSTKTLGIIGTAGRGLDAATLDVATMGVMKGVAQSFVKLLGVDTVVSGGSAWADSLAVHLYVNNLVPNLSLHLPCPFDFNAGRFDDTYDTGRALNHYHDCFEKITGHSSLNELALAFTKSIKVTYPQDHENHRKGFGLFFARNTGTANEADIMLAFTYGEKGKAQLKEGGTKDTMDKYLARQGKYIPSIYYGGFETQAYHFNLTDRIIYEL